MVGTHNSRIILKLLDLMSLAFIKFNPVSTLNSTPPRVYRQVASLMGLQLVTSFISVAKMLGAQRETTQRQLNAEKKKRVEGPRVESLNKRLSMTHKNITDLEDMMRKIFTGYDSMMILLIKNVEQQYSLLTYILCCF